MKNFLKKLFNRPNMEQVVIGMLAEDQKTLHSHIIALARLNFIKPEVLAREVNNVKDNSEYLLKMLEFLQEQQKEKTNDN